jgi:signal transduction histidine kinase
MDDQQWDGLHPYSEWQNETQQDGVPRHIRWWGWHRLALAYLPCLMLWGLTLLVILWLQQFLPVQFTFYLYSILFLIPVAITALYRGVGPTILLVLLGMVSLDYLYIPALQEPTVSNWVVLTELTAFALIGTGMAILTRQRQHARQSNLMMGQKEDQLHATMDHLDEATSMVCHELKTPMTITSTALHLLQHRLQQLNLETSAQLEGTHTAAELQTLLEQIQQQVNFQKRLVNDLMDASHLSDSKLTLCMQRHNLVTLVQDAVNAQRQIAPTRTIHLQLAPESSIPVSVDAERLQQVLNNYLTNALKYSEADQPVTVTLQKEEGQVRILVHDEGQGVPLVEQELIWERFYQVPGSRPHNDMHRGLGLGLYICRTIVALHNGQVGMYSTPGNGATFWCTLPLAE